MKFVLAALLIVWTASPASATGGCTTPLGLGVVGFNLAPSLKLIKRKGWEFDAYDVLEAESTHKLLLIYLGSHWGASLGSYTSAKAGPLHGVEQINQKQGRYSGTFILTLPNGGADKYLVYDYRSLTKGQYDTVNTLIDSTCLIADPP